jgi:membrane fusion protein (multidrug efflux system)
MQKKSNFVISFGVMLITLLLLMSCGNSKQEAAETLAETGTPQEEAIPVKVLKTAAEDFLEYVQATGTVKPWQEADIMSQTSGQIEELFMELGDFKKRDEVLLQVDDDFKQYAYDQAQAQHIQAQANYEKVKKDLERNQELYVKKSITEFEMENARLQERTAYANLISAKAALDTAHKQLEETKIKAPIDGEIAQKMVDVGDTISPGMPIAKIIEIRRLRILVGLSSQEIPKVKQNQEVQISVDAYQNMIFKGKVSFIGPQADLSSRTFPIEITVKNTPDKKLKPGMIARANILIGKNEKVVVVPQDSILNVEGKTVVFIIKGDRAERREIKVSKVFENAVCACQNVKAGELLVVTGQENLIEGALVTIIQ